MGRNVTYRPTPGSGWIHPPPYAAPTPRRGRRSPNMEQRSRARLSGHIESLPSETRRPTARPPRTQLARAREPRQRSHRDGVGSFARPALSVPPGPGRKRQRIDRWRTPIYAWHLLCGRQVMFGVWHRTSDSYERSECHHQCQAPVVTLVAGQRRYQGVSGVFATPLTGGISNRAVADMSPRVPGTGGDIRGASALVVGGSRFGVAVVPRTQKSPAKRGLFDEWSIAESNR
jgi:hypothetical protein